METQGVAITSTRVGHLIKGVAQRVDSCRSWVVPWFADSLLLSQLDETSWGRL